MAVALLAVLSVVSVQSVDGEASVVRFSSPRSCKGTEKERQSCPDLPECNPCTPVDCVFQDWSEWVPRGGCSQLCFRHRDIRTHANECGAECDGSKEESKFCAEPECERLPENCTFSSWGEWSICASPFDQRSRTREVAHFPKNGGGCCDGPLKETESCGTDDPVDCEFTMWGPWTVCDVTCGGGHQAQMRRIVKQAAHGGAPCEGTLRKTRICNTQPCEKPTDCQLGLWTEWSGCDAKDPTQKFRTREVIQSAAGGGKACNEPMHQTIGCVIANPPEDCVLSEWTVWNTCDVTCGGGQTYRSRSMVSPPKHGGHCDSGALQETKECNTLSCYNPEDDCVFSDWTAWGPCSVQCGTGESSRTRTVQKIAQNGGSGCKGAVEELQKCMVEDCNAADCVWGQWEDWQACTCSCGGGSRTRSRRVEVAPHLDGKLCEANSKLEVGACNTQPCFTCIDGVWDEWTLWSACSVTCGHGFRQRHRDVAQQANDCGKPALGLEDEYEPCESAQQCVEDRDCELTEWQDWSDCSCSCYGVKERHRNVLQYARGNGKQCPQESLKMTAACNPSEGETLPSACQPNDERPCVVGDWSEWSPCSASCDGGQTERKREILTPGSIGGPTCNADLRETKACGTLSCDTKCIDCEWSLWGDWSGCSRCNDQKYRRRTIARQPNHCGAPCDLAGAKETLPCTGDCEPTKFCAWTEWASMGDCPGHCGATSRLRQRSLTLSEEGANQSAALVIGSGDVNCNGMQLEQVGCPYIDCNAGAGPVDCVWGVWGPWSAPTFSQLCERKRTMATMNDHGGKPCDGPLTETKTCPTKDEHPPEDCEYSPWRDWSTCANEQAQRYRERVVVRAGANGGQACEGILHETGSCSLPPPAPQSCSMQAWSDWGGCTVTCGKCVTTRSRRVNQRALHGGEGCTDSMQEMKAVDLAPCGGAPVACVFGAWQGWSKCSDSNQQTRVRDIDVDSANGGADCEGEMTQIRPCKTIVDCQVSEWTNWDACDKTCGGGQQMRQRQVVVNPTSDGKRCPDELVETQGCAVERCPVQDCILGPWTAPSACSSSCGPGQQQRTREVKQYASLGGAGCNGSLVETIACNQGECSVKDCQWNLWSEWSACSISCGGGHRSRHRNIKVMPDEGGKACDPEAFSEVGSCSLSPCNSTCIDGEWEEWDAWEPCSSTYSGGVTWRTRAVRREANDCGKPAEGEYREMASCNEDVPCIKKQDCQVGEWTAWTNCSEPCNGVKHRARHIAVHARGGGQQCEDSLREVAPCNPDEGQAAPASCLVGEPRDCEVSEWTGFGVCSASCGGGQQVRERRILVAPANGGKTCPTHLEETSGCNTQDCPTTCEPQDCKWGQWSDWGACSKCSGEMRRFRSVVQHTRCGGKPCEMKDAEIAQKCPRQCHEPSYCGMGDWTLWGTCSSTCGEGWRERSRSLVLQPNPEVRFLDDASQLRLREEKLKDDLKSLAEHARELEGKRTRELVVSFGCGLAALTAAFAFTRSRSRGSSAALYSRTVLTETTDVGVE
eukprot:TRINITY_DN16839_c0_g1_i1.p1 TRINITY_DN16839_c0_g1~~TRINITY_DN16839_c0_g1_i1.p1  ORF type:complete len:1540 (+),score=305.14 TRINITY_DN16839_c0_g1_i1:64-4620(+)